MEIIEVNPRDCIRWKYADRSLFEYGDTNLLAEDIKRNGQIEPVFLRPLRGGEFKYEVIAGNRRFQACLNAGLLMKGVVYDVPDDRAAIIQVKENEHIALSDYSKGMSYARLAQDNKFTQEQLAEIAGVGRRKMQNLLCFAKVDQDIWDNVANMSKVSAKSAETILALSKKSSLHKEALINAAEEIRKGAGGKRIEQMVNLSLAEKNKGKEDKTGSEDCLTLPSGQVIGEWRGTRFVFEKDARFDKAKMNKHLAKFFV